MNEQLTIFQYTDEYKENQRIADIKLRQLAEKINGNGWTVDVIAHIFQPLKRYCE